MSLFNEADGLDVVCQQITVGRTLARQLATALRDHKLSEAEFRLLWLLRKCSTSPLESASKQSSLSTRLGISPAQVSAIVDKLQSQGTIASVEDPRDRRRRQWRLTSTGQQRCDAIHEVLSALSLKWLANCGEMVCSHNWEEAA